MSFPGGFQLSEFIKNNGAFLKEYGVNRLELFKKGKKIKESILEESPGKTVRFFIDYLSSKDELMIYSIARAVGGSGDNTYAKALSYQPGNNEFKEESAPLPFFQIPWGFLSLKKGYFFKELIKVVEQLQLSSPDHLKEGYLALVHYFKAFVDFTHLGRDELAQQLEASRSCGEWIKNQRMKEAYNHFLNEIQKQELRPNLHTMIRALMAEASYPILAQVRQKLLLDLCYRSTLAPQDAFSIWTALCTPLLAQHAKPRPLKGTIHLPLK